MAGIYLELGRGTGREGEVLKLPGRRFLVGRAAECEVRLRTDVVSRRHAELHLERGRWLLVDLDSRNGTCRNGKRIRRAIMRPLDTLKFGEAPGAHVRVLSLDPAPPMEADREDEQKPQLRGKRPPRPAPAPDAPPPPRKPRPVAGPVPTVPPLPMPPPDHALPDARPAGLLDVLRILHPLTVLGMAFGLFTAWEAWGPAFPYVEAAAPALWTMRLVNQLAPEVVLDHADWLLRFLLALWYGVLGLALERPFSRFVLLVLFVAAHVVAAVAGVAAIAP